MADLKRHEELVVITKTYDLILWSYNHTGKFLCNHCFVLGERIERAGGTMSAGPTEAGWRVEIEVPA